MGFLCNNLLSQRARPYGMLLLRCPAGIQYRRRAELFPVHSCINFDSILCKFWLSYKEQLIFAQVSFYGISPPLLPNLQKICKNLHVHEPAAALPQAVSKFKSCLLHLSRVSLLSLL